MRRAYYQDLQWNECVHIDKEEAELLQEYHNKKISTIAKQIEKLEDKADGSTRYDDKLLPLRNTLYYHKESFDNACRIIRFYNDKY